MKRIVCPLLLLLLPLLPGCGSQPDATDGPAHEPAGDRSTPTAATRPATVADEPTKYNEYRDPKTGMVQSRSPIPESWQVHGQDAPITMTSPRGLKVYKTESFQFGWSPDPFMQQSIRQMGSTVAPPVPLQQIVEQQIGPNARAQGYRLVGSFDAPGVEGLWRRLFAAMSQTGSRRTVDAMATEWQADTGTRSMIVLVQAITQSPQSMVWQLVTSQLEAPAEHYEPAKTAYLYALANTELNPEWIAASNRALANSIRETRQYWDNASQISAQAHQQRMRSIAARGAAARSVGQTYSDILDISHQGYLNRDSINNQGHGALVDSIQGTTVIGNHQTGEHYDVDGNNAYYWVNHDGAYIGTDNALFDPRLDELTRDDQWTRFHKER